LSKSKLYHLDILQNFYEDAEYNFDMEAIKEIRTIPIIFLEDEDNITNIVGVFGFNLIFDRNIFN